MKTVQVDERRVRLLIARFVEVCLEQYEIIYSLGRTSRYNRLFVEMQRIKAELQQMPGDQRRALLPLLSTFQRSGSIAGSTLASGALSRSRPQMS
jgi:hypothetical protein